VKGVIGGKGWVVSVTGLLGKAIKMLGRRGWAISFSGEIRLLLRQHTRQKREKGASQYAAGEGGRN
jgi:hypothetical protein